MLVTSCAPCDCPGGSGFDEVLFFFFPLTLQSVCLSALGKLRQGDYGEFEASLGYKANLIVN